LGFTALVGFTDAVAYAADGFEEFFFFWGIDFFSEALHVDIDEVATGVEVVVPDLFIDLDAGEDAAGGAHEEFEEGEFAGGEVDGLGAAFDLAIEQVEVEVLDLEDIHGVAGGTSGNGVDAGDEFLDKEWFGEVVIGTEVESFETFVEFAAGGEEDDGDGHALFAEAAKDAESIAAGEHDIEDDGIVGLVGGEVIAFEAVVCDVDDEAGAFESFGDERGDFFFVFDDEEFHGRWEIAGGRSQVGDRIWEIGYGRWEMGDGGWEMGGGGGFEVGGCG
jgi:hypothetical protein